MKDFTKKYIVYYQWDVIAKDSGDESCNHYFEEFDSITEAVKRFDDLGTSKKYILKHVAWKTEITEL